MLLPLLTFTAILVGSWTFAAIVSDWGSGYQETTQPSVLMHKRVSLWSLILFLFFPTASTSFTPKHFAEKRLYL